MKWINVGEEIKAADGRTGQVVAICDRYGEQLVKVEYDTDHHAEWFFASQFRSQAKG